MTKNSFHLGLLSLLWQGTALAQATMETVIVTASRTEQDLSAVSSSISVVDREELELIDAVHVNQVFTAVPGAWISRGNGQEHLTAIRSPVFTGPGSCGNFYMAEDGIPLRGTGFCNVNQLFDVNTEQAQRIEVLRGPGTTSHGADAMHGVINVISMAPAESPQGNLDLELGPYDYGRAKFSYSYLAGANTAGRISINAAHDGGYQDSAGYDQQKLSYRNDFNGDVWRVVSLLSVSNLDQDTAGYVVGEDAYEDEDIATSNAFPDAYRENLVTRFYSRFMRDIGDDGLLQLTPYLRYVDSEFLQHFLPGQPLEENKQQGLGVQVGYYQQTSDVLDWRVGTDLEYTDAELVQTQFERVPWSDIFPVGKQYDYAVDAISVGAYAGVDWLASNTTLVNAGLRYNGIWYNYDNRMIDGATTEDGTPCGDNPCRYSRPADRDDSFRNWSYDVGVTQDVSDNLSLTAAYKHGFRPPQATELYRLQNGQQVADIKPEEIDSIEAGLRGIFAAVEFSVVGFWMHKENVIFSDSERRNVSDGKTRHYGLEYSLWWQLHEQWSLNMNGTFARHLYANNPDLVGVAPGTDIEGNDLDTAPRHMGSVKLNWNFSPKGLAELEWVNLGSYYLDPINEFSYEGYNLFNLRSRYQFTPGIGAGLRITNLANVKYAERADYAFGDYRYFVGQPRGLYADISFSF
jgi:outer membrane receptor protein involved in Fe transport